MFTLESLNTNIAKHLMNVHAHFLDLTTLRTVQIIQIIRSAEIYVSPFQPHSLSPERERERWREREREREK